MCVSWTLDGFIGVIRGLLVPLLGLSCLRHDYNNNLTASVPNQSTTQPQEGLNKEPLCTYNQYIDKLPKPELSNVEKYRQLLRATQPIQPKL